MTAWATQGGSVVGVAVVCAALAGSAAASAPPAKPLLVDVARGAVGGLQLGQSSERYVQKLGLPDYSGAIETANTRELLWTLGPSPRSGWAAVTLTPSSAASVFRYAGRFTTPNGDMPGTPLATVRKQWGPTRSVHSVVRKGRTVEYNLAVGRVVFAFDARMRLQAVGLATASLGGSLCIIPSVCVVSTLGP